MFGKNFCADPVQFASSDAGTHSLGHLVQSLPDDPCAAAILRRDGRLNRLRFPVSDGMAADAVLFPANILLSSAIWESIWSFCASKPEMAAMMISGVSVFGMSSSSIRLMLYVKLSY